MALRAQSQGNTSPAPADRSPQPVQTPQAAKRPALSLAERAYQEIKRMFMVSELVAGQKLRYQDIARKLDMSQTPVIQALTRLENEGLVVSEANKGFFVPELDLQEARELYEMRALIESFLIRRTARRITTTELQRLKVLIEEHRQVRGEFYTRRRLWYDAKLHLAMASYSGHQNGRRFLRHIFDRLVLRYRPERLSADRMAVAEEEHRLIYRALQDHDPERAAELVEKHIASGSKHIIKGLEEQMRYRRTFSPWD